MEKDGFTKVPNELLKKICKTKISDYEHRMYWWIVRKTFGFHKEFDWISGSQFQEATGINQKNQSKVINKLVDKNLIGKNGKKFFIVKSISIQINSSECKKDDIQVNDYNHLSRCTQNKHLQNKTIQNDDISFDEIINYLNLKTGKNFKSSITSTRKLIISRFEEGFTLDDFKKVIDIKVKNWNGDEMMNKHLRPITLFGEKFESYLNEAVSKNRYTFKPYKRG